MCVCVREREGEGKRAGQGNEHEGAHAPQRLTSLSLEGTDHEVADSKEEP